MKLIKIGLANPDPTVGAFKSNVDKLVELATKMSRENCTIGCFSEQSIPGYPVEDWVLWGKFIEGQWDSLVRFAEETQRLPTIFVVGLAVQHESNAYNVAAVVCNGRIIGLVPKEKLPTYGVFYEKRTYSAGIPGFVGSVNDVPFGDIIFQFPFGKVAVEVCEDIWSPDGPMRRRAYSGAETIINISASPYRAGVVGTRRELISTRAADNVATVVYVNQFGGNDGLAFDGGGFVNQCGRMLLEARRWDEGFSTQVVDLERTSRQRRENTTWRSDREIFFRNEKPTEVITPEKLVIQMSSGYKYPVPTTKSFFIPAATIGPNPQEEYFHDLVEAMLTGLDGYFRKTGAFDRIGIAMSGGKDSALTLLLAHLYATKKLEKSGKEL
jgi:NAD+ synthase (glutamine-hydrolysing)